MVDAIVYRKLPDLPHRQYVKRVIDRRHVLWHRDPAIAKRMSHNDAKTLARILQARSTGWGGVKYAVEPAGEYGTEEATR